LILFLEQDIIEQHPADQYISTVLSKFDTEHVHIAWQKALERRHEDPEAAITMARTLIESVCKHILDEAGVPHNEKDDLPKLYKETAKQLNMAPEQHQEEVFKQILGGCQTVIQGLGTLRNKLSDAHGQGKKAVKPSSRHAALAVNLAGAMTVFLVASWEEKSQKSS
jgi:Abortive infection C-terminus